MKDQEIQKILREQAEQVQIPESLEPEQMMKQIEAKAKKKKTSYYKKFAVAAASCVLIVGIGVAGISGLFGIHSNQNQKPTGSGSQGLLQVASIETAEDYKEIYQLLQEENERGFLTVGADMAKSEATVNESASIGDVAPRAGVNYSDTNIREKGVGEADVVKTDGKYMYVLNYPKLDIVDISQERMEHVSSVKLPEEGWFGELYVKGDRLVAVYTISEPSGGDEKALESEESSAGVAVDTEPSGYREFTIAETFDISNPQNPKSIGKIKQSGSYHTSRFVGDAVYVMSHYAPEAQILREDAQTYVPMIQGEILDRANIYMPMTGTAGSYTVISSFSLQDPKTVTDKKAVLGGAELSYISKENIYVTEVDYGTNGTEENYTCIRKISYKNGKIKGVAQTKIEGILNDSFSLDEYKGNLRLVTTLQESNSLLILDKNLKVLSKMENLAKGEQVHSARFMGDIGYFVTFKEIDPLFSVNLKDPKNPKILGELKIPGFSEYLHPYGEGKLLGIGMDVDEAGTTTNGVKLSMFDISNPADVKEQQKYVIQGTYSTDVAYNYKVAFVQPEKNLIGFVAYGETIQYYVFTYDPEQGFQTVFVRDMTGLPTDVRAFYVGNKFLLVAGNVLESYQLDTFEKLDDLVL